MTRDKESQQNDEASGLQKIIGLPHAQAQYFFILLCPVSNTLTIIR